MPPKGPVPINGRSLLPNGTIALADLVLVKSSNTFRTAPLCFFSDSSNIAQVLKTVAIIAFQQQQQDVP